MKKYTKLCVATLCFIASASALADGYKGEAPPLVPVSIPAFNGGFEFTIGALYMEPDSSNVNYLTTQDNRIGSINTINNRVNYGVDTNYGWGFVLGIGYVIPATANDVKLDWTYFHNDFNSSEFLLGDQTSTIASLVPLVNAPLSLDTTESLNASGQMNYKFDAVDLTFGQYLNIGSRLQTRLFTGLRYMRLDSDLSTSYSTNAIRTAQTSSTPILETFQSGDVDSSFNGLGPLLGLKADYYLGAGFSLSGGIDGALLVGQLGLDASSQSNTLSQTGPSDPWVLTNVDTANLSWGNQAIIAPGFDAKFGLDYKYQFNNGTLLGVELGYQVTKYIDVIQEAGFGELPTGSFEALSYAESSNFRLAGPYLTLNVKV